MGILISVVLGFTSGVFLHSIFIFGWPVIIFILILAMILAGEYFFKPRRVYSLAAVFCLLVAFGMIRAVLVDTPLPKSFASQLRHRVSYQGVVVADPDVRDSNQRIEIRVSNKDETTKMLAIVPRDSSVSVGDKVFVSGTLSVPSAFATDGGRIFRYDKYLERQGVRFILNFGSIKVLENAPWYSVTAALARIKNLFLNGLRVTLPEPYASLAGGIVIGGKTGLGTELQKAFTRSGLIQIIVLSGYNVMIVAEWVMTWLAFIRISKRWRAVAGALAITLFVGIAGASATALRAALMAIIALYARATGRSYVAGRALLFTVLLLLTWNPLYLAFDPGFGLSVVATAGIIWLAPIFETVLAKLRLRKANKHQESEITSRAEPFWQNAVATTVAAQIAVLPLLLYDTGNLSIIAIPANLLTMPIVPLAMFLSALAGLGGMLFGFILPSLGIIIAFPSYIINYYLIFVAQKSAALPFAAFTIQSFPFWVVLIAYTGLICIIKRKMYSFVHEYGIVKRK